MNPVFRKDLLGLLRLRRVAAIQVLFVATLAGLLLATWPQGGVYSLASRAHDNLLLGLVLGQLVLLALFVPGMAAVALSGEREENTLEMLYASRLSATQIILGKVLSATSYPVLLLLSGLPFVALLNWRGDVDLPRLVSAYGVLVLAAVFLAVVSLTVSALSKQSATALVVSYAIVLVLCGGVLVPAAIMLDGAPEPIASVLHYTRALSPVAAILSLLRPSLGGGDFAGTGRMLLPSWQVFVPLAMLVIVLCFGVLVARLRKPPTASDALGSGRGSGDARSVGRRILYLIDDKKKPKPFASRGFLAQKERRTNQLRSGRWMIRIFYGCVLISLGLALMSLFGGTEHQDLLRYVAAVLITFQLGVIALVSPSLTSSAVSSELESGTWEVLRLAPVSGSAIFWGKFIPAFLPALLPIVALLPAYGAICFIDPGYIARLQLLLPLILLSVALCCTIGLTASSFIPNTARATVVAYIATAVLFVVPMIGWWAGESRLIDTQIAKWVAFPSPIAVGLNLLPEATPEIRDLLPQHLILVSATCLLLLVVSRLRLSYLLRQG